MSLEMKNLMLPSNNYCFTWYIMYFPFSIKVLLDCDKRQLSFRKNGRDQGCAFDDLPAQTECVCSESTTSFIYVSCLLHKLYIWLTELFGYVLVPDT